MQSKKANVKLNSNMAQSNDLEPSTSSVQSTDQIEGTNNLVRLPKVLLKRIDEKTILKLQSPPKKPRKIIKKISDNEKKVLKKSPKKTNDSNRPRGRPKKTSNAANLPTSKKGVLKLGVKNKTVTSNKKSPLVKKNNLQPKVKTKTAKPTKTSSKEEIKLKSKPGKLLKKTMLQKMSKVVIPLAKKTKVSPKKTIRPKSPTEAKPSPPKPKLEVIQSNPGENSSDTSGDEFLYDELIEELENTVKRNVEVKTVPDKTTITLKPSAGNKPPTVLKGGIIKRTDLPSDLSLFAQSNKQISNVMTNGQTTPKQTSVMTTGVKRKNSDIFDPSSSAKKPSPWPVSFITSPKKSPAPSINNQKKKDLTSKIVVTKPEVKPKPTILPKNAYSPPIPPKVLPAPVQTNSISLGNSKPKIGPKQTAKVIPLSKSFEADDYLSDEYLEEERLECDLEVYEIPKESNIKSDGMKTKLSKPDPSKDNDANLDLIKILTDESEEPIAAKSIEVKEKPSGSKVDKQTIGKKDKATPQAPEETQLDTTSEESKNVEIEEAPVRTIYDLMNEVFLDYPSWNLHLIPETSAFCIAQVTKGRLGLPTLKKCIELDPVSYKAKVYIHQYHIKRFDGIYDGEESILALIREIDSIKA